MSDKDSPELEFNPNGNLAIRNTDTTGIHVNNKSANEYLKDTKSYYLPGFLTKVKHATKTDLKNVNVYAIQLLKDYHQLVLPIYLIDREEHGTIFSQEKSYYAKLGNLVIGILNISIRHFSKNRDEIVYTYRYKTDNRDYYSHQNDRIIKVKDLKKYSKDKMDLIYARESAKRKKEKLD